MKLCPRCSAAHGAVDWVCPACHWHPQRRGRIYDLTGDGVERQLGFEAHAFQDLAAVEDEYFWFRARNALIEWALTTYLPGSRTFLEVGCGNGQVLRALQRAAPELRLTASEAFYEGLHVAAARLHDIDLLRVDVRRLPFVEEFDVVGAFDVLEHVDDDHEAMQQIAGATKRGGGVLITVPQHPRLWSEIDAYSHHRRRYTRATLTALLQTAGLSLVRMTSFVSLLLPGLLMSRILRRGRPVDPVAEYQIPPAVNRLAGAMMGIERRLIRAGVSFPAGGSLLAVARR
jgi:SAM-dependent methyltransferase